MASATFLRLWAVTATGVAVAAGEVPRLGPADKALAADRHNSEQAVLRLRRDLDLARRRLAEEAVRAEHKASGLSYFAWGGNARWAERMAYHRAK